MDTADIVIDKPLATPTLAEQLGQWAGENAIRTIHVFGVDIVFGTNAGGEQCIIPRQFNDVAWSEALLDHAQAKYKASSSGELGIEFIGGIKPGDPGFELPEPVLSPIDAAR